MGFLDLMRGNSVASEAGRIEQLSTALREEQETNMLLLEGMADLELALDDKGWEKLAGDLSGEMSRSGLGKAADLCRVMAVGNPLIKRGLNVRQSYVFGSGIDISARDPKVDEIVQAFLRDPSNKSSITGSQAKEELERSLGTDGNIFLAHFTTPKTGRVEVRSFPFAEIKDIICNPEDRDEPWYYEREWRQTSISPDGQTETRNMKMYYPDLRYRPASSKRFSRINGHPVNWNAPIWHVSVNRLDGWKFGIGDAFAAIAWARGYKEFLEDWATLVKALSRFAWKAQGKNRSTSQKMRDKIARRPEAGAEIGGAAIMDSESDLTPIPKTGAVIDSSSGKPLAAMVASALEISLVVLITDPGSSGARAVAETLDEPTIRMAEKRRELWRETYDASLNYVIDAAIKAGKLPGNGKVYDPDLRRFTSRLSGDDLARRSFDIAFPELGSESVKDRVSAVVEAHSTSKVPFDIVARLLLQALGVENADDIVEKMIDDNGNFIDPELNATMAAVKAFRQGRDPAQTLSGNPEPEEDEDEDEDEE